MILLYYILQHSLLFDNEIVDLYCHHFLRTFGVFIYNNENKLFPTRQIFTLKAFKFDTNLPLINYSFFT